MPPKWLGLGLWGEMRHLGLITSNSSIKKIISTCVIPCHKRRCWAHSPVLCWLFICCGTHRAQILLEPRCFDSFTKQRTTGNIWKKCVARRELRVCLPRFCHSVDASSLLWQVMGVPVNLCHARLFVHYWTFHTTFLHSSFSTISLYTCFKIDKTFWQISFSEHSRIEEHSSLHSWQDFVL